MFTWRQNPARQALPSPPVWLQPYTRQIFMSKPAIAEPSFTA